MTTQETCEKLTAGIIRQLEEGKVPWKRPFPEMANLNSGRGYRGMNKIILACAAEEHGYTSPYWTTFKGAQEIGGKVRKGEHATFISFWKELPKKGNRDETPEIDAPTGKNRRDTFLMCQTFCVFNLSQIDGITPEMMPKHVKEAEAAKENRDPVVAAEAIIENMPQKPVIKHGGIAACYIPKIDEVHLPAAENFSSRDEYYATAYHELAHSTGHETRLNRPEIQESRFGTAPYSKEELLAEFSANFLMAEAGISHQKQLENSASYCAGWLSALKNDRQMLMAAGTAAGRVTDYICNRGPEKVLEKTKNHELVPTLSIPDKKPEPEAVLALNGRSQIAKNTDGQMGFSL